MPICVFLANLWGFKNLAEKSLAIGLELKQQITCQSSAALLYNKATSFKIDQGQLHESLRLSSECISISEALGDKQMMSNTFVHTAVIHILLGHYENAIEYCAKAMKISIDYGLLMAQSVNTLTLLIQGKIERASILLDQANHGSDVENGTANTLLWSSKALVKLHDGDLQSALDIIKKLIICLNEQALASLTVFAFENIAIVIEGLQHCEILSQVQFSHLVKDLTNAWKNYLKAFPVANIPLMMYTAKLDLMVGNKQKAQATFVSALKMIQQQKQEYPYHQAVMMDDLAAITGDSSLSSNAKKMLDSLGIPKRESIFQHYSVTKVV